MSDFNTRRVQAIEACDKVINGIEEGSLTVSSSLLLCRKIALLVNDEEGQNWLAYENNGYPYGENGGITNSAWKIAVRHGRQCQIKGADGKTRVVIFTELCDELEATVNSNLKALNNFTTHGCSVSGEQALQATERLAVRVAEGTLSLLKNIKLCERYLSILKSQYYDYALNWKMQLYFGSAARTVFEEYQGRVDVNFASFPVTTLQKLRSIEGFLENGNPEQYAQVLTSCRRLWSDIAKGLFSEILPDYTEKLFKTKNGEIIDITGDHVNNKLFAIIETLQSKAAKNTLVGSEIKYLVDWLEQINDLQNAGVHASVSRTQAMQCLIHTYIALGDILILRENAKNN